MYSNNNSNRNMSRNSFQRNNKSAAVEEFSLKSVLFPELPDNNDKDSSSVTSSINIINYKLWKFNISKWFKINWL